MITDLKQHAENILFVKDNFKTLNDSIIALHQLYTSYTGISASDINDKDIMLDTGKAISPIKAAHCLLETNRTTAFLRGIYKAILRLQKDFPDEKINILYAGSGPYATLLTPITTQFSHNELGIYMMEINETSLEAVKKLYSSLGILEYIETFICADAATYQLPKDKIIHLIVSETMKEGLQKEPQVSIMLNLVPQMTAKTIFIPEEISVSLKLIFGGEELQSFFEDGE